MISINSTHNSSFPLQVGMGTQASALAFLHRGPKYNGKVSRENDEQANPDSNKTQL